MEALNTTPTPPILSIQETVALMAKRPGITTGGGIELNTPNPDPRAEEPPTDEDDVVADHRIRLWMEQNELIRRVQDNYRKKVSAGGGKYIKPRIWTPSERARLMEWRRQYGETTGTGVNGRIARTELRP